MRRVRPIAYDAKSMARNEECPVRPVEGLALSYKSMKSKAGKNLFNNNRQESAQLGFFFCIQSCCFAS
jgi:hypothetical protein